jgi:DNA polymerase I-like protein with 3'-5' exonuclease and polymerase domains
MTTFELKDNILPTPEYEYITKADDVPRVIEELMKHPEIEFDTETTGFDPFTKKPVLAQFGVVGKAFVVDVRHDTEHSDINLNMFKPVLNSNSIKKILQNAVFDMKMVKHHCGFYLENVYDTMLVEQLFNLGAVNKGATLKELVFKYLGLQMPKEPSTTFQEYNQTYKPFQLEYAAKDVSVLTLIKQLQEPRLIKEGFEDVARLEFEFTKPMCEMELNGITIDKDKWRIMMTGFEEERKESISHIHKLLAKNHGQNVLFGIPVINIDSNKQLLKSLQDYGLNLDNTNEATLSKFKGVPVVDHLLNYRKLNKLISTYGESLLDRIHPYTGRLHTRFRQMVSTGRMSSSNPNLQNIPKKQKFRSCFISKEGYKLITADMSSAELRILGNLSNDPVFIECLSTGADLHSRSASEVFKVPIDKVDKKMRNSCKAISFGLMYGLSKYGLAARLNITEKKAEELINNYFSVFSSVKTYLELAAKNAVRKGFSDTIAGRKRFYNIPPYGHPDRNKIQKAVERQAKNAGIQGCLIFDTVVKGIGKIGNQIDKKIEIETGFGEDTALGVYSGKKDVYDLKLSNGVSLGITLGHKIPTISKTSRVELCKDIAVDDLSSDDLIMIPLNVVEGKSTDLCGYKYRKGHWRETFVDYSLPEKMDSKLAFIIGCLIGDGSYTKHNHFKFCCPENQIELFEKFNMYVEKVFGYKPVSRRYSKDRNITLYTSQVSSVVIRGFLKHIGLDYVKHHDKVIPECFYTETIENKSALLNGLFSTDGGMPIKSGPYFTTVSKDLANAVHQLLFSLGINSNLKTYEEEKGTVYRLQIPKRFNSKFKEYIGFSVNEKQALLDINCSLPKFGDDSIVPEFIPKTIERVLRNSPTFFNDFTSQEKAHLRRFKLGKCSFSSWRKFFKKLPECEEKTMLSKYLDFDFCRKKSLDYIGKHSTYDLMCDNIHYFTANGVMVHNSNADTIKESMINVVNRLENSTYDAKLLLTVHDEVIVEVRDDQVEEVSEIIKSSIIDGFGRYFSKIPMETDALVGPTWLKDNCDRCKCTEMKLIPDEKTITKLVCSNCGADQE